jgi:hypothetical protein
LAEKNVHGYTLAQIKEIAARWEPTPPYYTTLNIGVRLGYYLFVLFIN